MSTPSHNGHPDRDPKEDLGRVAADDACPNCGEDHSDRLIWLDDDRVHCFICGTVYQPGRGSAQP
jgi:hypothetical protein